MTIDADFETLVKRCGTAEGILAVLVERGAIMTDVDAVRTRIERLKDPAIWELVVDEEGLYSPELYPERFRICSKRDGNPFSVTSGSWYVKCKRVANGELKFTSEDFSTLASSFDADADWLRLGGPYGPTWYQQYFQARTFLDAVVIAVCNRCESSDVWASGPRPPSHEDSAGYWAAWWLHRCVMQTEADTEPWAPFLPMLPRFLAALRAVHWNWSEERRAAKRRQFVYLLKEVRESVETDTINLARARPAWVSLALRHADRPGRRREPAQGKEVFSTIHAASYISGLFDPMMIEDDVDYRTIESFDKGPVKAAPLNKEELAALTSGSLPQAADIVQRQAQQPAVPDAWKRVRDGGNQLRMARSAGADDASGRGRALKKARKAKTGKAKKRKPG